MANLLSIPINTDLDHIEIFASTESGSYSSELLISTYMKDGIDKDDIFFYYTVTNDYNTSESGYYDLKLHILAATTKQGDSLNNYLKSIDILPTDVGSIKIIARTANTNVMPITVDNLAFDRLYAGIIWSSSYTPDTVFVSDSIGIGSELVSQLSFFNLVFGNYYGNLYQEPENKVDLNNYEFRVIDTDSSFYEYIDNSVDISDSFVKAFFSNPKDTDSGWRQYINIQEVIQSGDLDQYLNLLDEYQEYILPCVIIEKNINVLVLRFDLDIAKVPNDYYIGINFYL